MINQIITLLDEFTRKIKTELRINKKRTLADCVRMLLAGKLQDRFYVLSYLKDRKTGNLYHLVLDFQQVGNQPFKETAVSLEEDGWTRICRIDAPIIDDLLQKYSAYSSRIGIQAIPEDVIDGLINEIKEIKSAS